ncbi:L-type lectin-domain containing receptor kinase VIII.1-like [Cynara cardunculus var. scolymus]|uniref:L-type lectin-domain containing receptor kinase VIII.1-like n=1 Tax=Cynara cardunculus var. scolymus TaxID=59895 RepID=UPI000D6274B7|nr:L-type lectin-domain containing receptor kinase VIII.1-like [Cynara cardunculus var. scolymus]
MPSSISGRISVSFLPCFLLFIYFSVNAVAGIISFDFQTLSLSTLKLLGDAHLVNTSIMLTRDLAVPNSGAGGVLYNKPIRFKRPGTGIPASFSSFFSFSVANLNPASIGGGLAFVISPDDETLGDAGGYLGIPAGAIAVEFDTLMDVEFKDINGNHLGVDLNSVVSTEVVDLDSVDVDLRSGNQVNSWVEFNGSTQLLNISISYSNIKPISPILSIPMDLNKYLNEFMYVGFTGSTQGSTEVHSVEWWTFSSSFDDPTQHPPPPTATVTNPSADAVISPPPSMPPMAGNRNTSTHHSTQKQSKCHNQLCKEGAGAVVGVVTAGAFVLALCAIFLIWVYSKKFKRSKKAHLFSYDIIKTPKEFSYKELKLATKCFDSSRVIGHGAFGTVYRGVLPDTGDMVAVKRCSHTGGQGMEEFLSELSIIGTLRHRNLVRLQGWCHEKGEILLVYDLMPNGSLDKALFESRLTLPWVHRSKILMGVASALAYLHQECENQVIHRDVKTSNIMLDEGFNAKLGDFGLARRIEHDKSPDATVAAGTMGYLAPEYLLTGRASEKTDVFSYGAVVLEVASGRRPIERDSFGSKTRENSNLVEWVWGLHREERLLAAADPRLCGEFDEAEMRKVLLIGLVCSHPDPVVRPTMRTVVQMLVGEAEAPVVPRAKPSMTFSTSHLLLNLQDSVSDLNGLITLSNSSSDHNFNGDGLDLV